MNYRRRVCLYFVIGSIIPWNELCADALDIRDPTRPLIVEVVEADKKIEQERLVLQSIIISPTRRIALINDEYVKVGDYIGLYKINSIEKNSVVLTQPGQKKIIYLFD